MPQKNLEFDRDELYADVWSTPVSKLAVQHGVTSYVIVKAAKKLGVPLPPNGYWTLVAQGKPTSKPPLPKDGYPQRYRDTWKVPYADDALLTRVNEALDAKPAVEIALPHMATSVSECLAIVRRTAAELKKASPDNRGWHRTGYRGNVRDCSLSGQQGESAPDARSGPAAVRGRWHGVHLRLG